MSSSEPPPPDGGVSGPTSAPPAASPQAGIPSAARVALHNPQNPNPSPGSAAAVGSSSEPSPSSSTLPPPDGTSLVGRSDISLGHRPTSSIPVRRYPKVSSNFDAPEGSTRQQTTQVNPKPPVTTNQTPAPAPKPMNTANKGFAKITFAEAAARKAAKPADLFTHNLNSIKPIKMSDGLAVIMPDDWYEKSLKTYQYALIGRLLLPQGAAPRPNDQIKGELSALFSSTGEWSLMPLGKGFFTMKFMLQEDHIKAARQSSWKLSVGFLQIRAWKPNFDPYHELSSTAQIWVRLYHLPTEYWIPEFLVGVFRTVGNVIKLDGNMAQGLVGHFARTLVEVDLASPLINSVRVGLSNNLFYVDFSYENIPLLCTFCHFVEHSVDKCRKAKAADANSRQEELHKPKNNRPPQKQWVEKPDDGHPAPETRPP